MLAQYIALLRCGWDGAGGGQPLSYVWGNPTAKLPASLAQRRSFARCTNGRASRRMHLGAGTNPTGLKTVHVLFGGRSRGDALSI